MTFPEQKVREVAEGLTKAQIAALLVLQNQERDHLPFDILSRRRLSNSECDKLVSLRLIKSPTDRPSWFKWHAPALTDLGRAVAQHLKPSDTTIEDNG